MHRTTVMLPDELKREAERLAKEMHSSVGELIRQGLRRLLKMEVKEKQAHGKAVDALYADTAVWRKGTDGDVSEKHDEYLYGN